MTQGQYTSIHVWLAKNYGPAQKCENKLCKSKSVKFEWALKKGKMYDKVRANFKQLCHQCHSQYDHKYNNYHPRTGANATIQVRIYQKDYGILRRLALRRSIGGKDVRIADIIKLMVK